MILLLALGCAPKIAYTTPIPPDDHFAVGQPSAQERARFQEAAAWSDAHDGLALLVLRGDELIFEHYAEGWSAEQPHHLFSGTKSFTCALALAAQEDGLLDLDAPASTWVPSWEGQPGYEDITPRHLLHFTSGLQQDWWHLTRDGLQEEQRIEDKAAWAVAQPLVTSPGEVFSYGSVNLVAFNAVLDGALDEDALAYLSRRVLEPIGFRYSGWIRDPAGHPMLPYGAWTTAYEWLKYGAWVRDTPALHACFQGSEANPAYGLTFWLNAETEADLSAFPSLEEEGPALWAEGPSDLVAAAGHDDQRLYIIPSQDLVIARLGDGHREFSDSELVELILGTEE